jgi:hypothetical protein
MSEKSSNSPAMAFILDYLKEKGDTPYRDVRSAAEAAGHAIFPIMYGRAKTLLGMITEPATPRRRRPRAPDADAGADDAPLIRGRLRQGSRGNIADSTAEELSGFLTRYREIEEERNRYRAALIAVEKMLRRTIQETE